MGKYILVKPHSITTQGIDALQATVDMLPGGGKFRKDEEKEYVFNKDGFLYLDAYDTEFLLFALVRQGYIKDAKTPDPYEVQQSILPPIKEYDSDQPYYVIAYDLGQARDYTAAVTLSCYKRVYTVKEIIRFPLGTSYPDIVMQFAKLWGITNLNPKLMAIDKTGVGRPVWDMIKTTGVPFTGVVITGGKKATREGTDYHVPKTDLVSAIQIVLQQRRLKFIQNMNNANLLFTELQDFEIRTTHSGNTQYGVWRENQYDDLVLALAIAVWLAEVGVLPPRVKAARDKRALSIASRLAAPRTRESLYG